jgi:pimeloyl-ACP methyl ester carboxylesterase
MSNASSAPAARPETLERKHVTVNGSRFTYLDIGPEDGPLVLCIHGFPDHPLSFVPVMERLAKAGYRTVAPWLRGYAPSTLEGPFHMDQIGDDIAGIARALSDKPVALVGHDWGAIATYGALARYPELFHAGVTLAVPHPERFALNMLRYPRQFVRSSYMILFQVRRFSDYIVSRNNFEFIDFLWSVWSPGYKPNADHMAELKRTLALSMPNPLRYYRDNVTEGKRLREWPMISTPTLYLHGRDDGCAVMELAEGQERYFSGPLESGVIQDAGHFLQLEQPAAVADHIRYWLSSHGAT